MLFNDSDMLQMHIPVTATIFTYHQVSGWSILHQRLDLHRLLQSQFESWGFGVASGGF